MIKTSMENQYTFILFAFGTCVFNMSDVKLLNIVQWVMHNNVMTVRSIDVVFKRIKFVTQKMLTIYFVVFLPVTTI